VQKLTHVPLAIAIHLEYNLVPKSGLFTFFVTSQSLPTNNVDDMDLLTSLTYPVSLEDTLKTLEIVDRISRAIPRVNEARTCVESVK